MCQVQKKNYRCFGLEKPGCYILTQPTIVEVLFRKTWRLSSYVLHGHLLKALMFVFESVVAIVFQSTFYSKMHQNNVFF